MSSSTNLVYVGIDLGTTNSTAAVFDGDKVTLVRNSQGSPITPSVVRIDGRGNVIVGARARRLLESDPDNTRGEFKRLMGSAERLPFEAAGRTLLPEELSAAVLSSLLADARDALGFAPRSAVISTPALFEVPCSFSGCSDGGYDVTREILIALASHKVRFEGEHTCAGSSSAGDCGRVLRYVATATYRSNPGS